MRAARALLLLLVAFAAAVAAGAATARAPAGSTGSYAYGADDQGARTFVGRVQELPGFTGGPITAASGETVTVYSDDGLLAADPSANQRWADFVAGLLHGPELGTLRLYIAPLSRVRGLCGVRSLGCYESRSNTIVAIGQDVRGVSAASVVIHEYGHHLANSRRNDPWPAIDWGTKRWATYVNVCQRARAGQLVPGNEDRYYDRNPGELFAETYRVLSERRAGLPESSWDVVDSSLYPDALALQLLEQDITRPWAGNTAEAYPGLMTPRATGRGVRLQTAYDGTLEATLALPKRADFDLRVVDLATGEVLAAASQPVGRPERVRVQVCGVRNVQLQVKRISGSGSFTVTVSKP